MPVINSKILVAATAAVFALGVVGAKASTMLEFSVSGAGGPTVTFELPLSPAISTFDANSFTINSVPTTIDSVTASQAISFDTLVYSGAFKVSSLYLVGPQLFTGPVYAPQFLTGIFAITDYDFSQGGCIAFNQTLTIADVNATPLPSSWLMMLTSLFVVFFAYRWTKESAAPIVV